jgi:hypothetical protein
MQPTSAILPFVTKGEGNSEYFRFVVSDGGETVHADNDKFNQAMSEAAEQIHLAEHDVAESGIRLCSPGDIEGHIGSDSHFYLLDLARTFPAEDPSQCKHLPYKSQAVFYRLMRPELLLHLKEKKLTLPLSSDAMTGFGYEKDFDARSKLATKLLLETIIPDFAKELSAMQLLTNLPSFSNLLHERGINMR